MIPSMIDVPVWTRTVPLICSLCHSWNMSAAALVLIGMTITTTTVITTMMMIATGRKGR